MGLEQYVSNFVTFVNNLVIPFLIGLAFLFFVINAFRFFVVGGANADGREKARSLAVYGILAFVLIIVFWGIINLLSSSLGLERLASTTPRCPDYNPDCERIAGDFNAYSENFDTTGIGDPRGPSVGSSDTGLPTSSNIDRPPAFVAPDLSSTSAGGQLNAPQGSSALPLIGTPPGITGGEYTNVGRNIVPTLTTPSGDTTFLSTEFENVSANNVTDDSRLLRASAFAEAGIISNTELADITAETNSIRGGLGEPMLDPTLLPNPNPAYVNNLSTYHSNSNLSQSVLTNHYGSIGLTPTQVTERVEQDMSNLYNSDLDIVERMDNAYAVYNQMTGTQVGNATRNSMLTHFVASVNAEIDASTRGPNSSPINNGQPISITDVTGG